MQKSKSQIPRIERATTKIIIPHDDDLTTFAYPCSKPDVYSRSGKEILKKGLKIPTGDQIAHLLYATFCVPEVSHESEFDNIKHIVQNEYLWIFNRNLWTKDGVYVVYDEKVEGEERLDNTSQVINDLEKKLLSGLEISGVKFSEDKKVRFAPKSSYKLAHYELEKDPETVANDGFIIASFGEEGAKKISEVWHKMATCWTVQRGEKAYDQNQWFVSVISYPHSWEGSVFKLNGVSYDSVGQGFEDDYEKGYAFGILE